MPRFTAGTTTSSSVRRTVGHGSSSMAGYAIGFGPSSTNAGRAVEVRAVGVDTLIIAGEMTTSPSTASSTFRVPLSSSDSPEQDHQLESRMREIRQSGSEGGGGREVSPYPNLGSSQHRASSGAPASSRLGERLPAAPGTTESCYWSLDVMSKYLEHSREVGRTRPRVEDARASLTGRSHEHLLCWVVAAKASLFWT